MMLVYNVEVKEIYSYRNLVNLRHFKIYYFMGVLGQVLSWSESIRTFQILNLV